MRAGLVAALILLAGPATARAGTVAMTADRVMGDRVTWAAEPGERNDLRISRDALAVVLEDAGAPLAAGSGCEQVSAHLARCAFRAEWLPAVAAQAGDGDDSVTARDFRLTLDGGPGDDRLTSAGGGDLHLESTLIGRDGDDLLTGGAGHDAISGGRGSDTLIGGDGRDTFFGEHEDEDVSTDVVDGGPDVDTVSYHDRAVPILIDLRTQRSGQAGEADVLSSVEGGQGGGANDRLIGGEAYGSLSGGAGDDVVVGTPGADNLSGGPGADRIDAGAGDDIIRSGEWEDPRAADRVSAGPGDDRLHVPSGRLSCGAGRDLIETFPARRPLPLDCERVSTDAVMLTLPPLRVTAREVVLRGRTGYGGARARGVTLRAGRTVLARSRPHRLPRNRSVRWAFVLTRAGQRALRDGRAAMTLRSGGRDRVTIQVRRP